MLAHQMEKEMDINNLKSMGMHLVRVLVENTFEGTMELDRTEGTKLNLKLKKLQYRQRN
jgi:two-component sensor histidine kinase